MFDSNNNRVQKFNGNGTFLTKWSGEFRFGTSVSVDGAGKVYLGDMERVHIYAPFLVDAVTGAAESNFRVYPNVTAEETVLEVNENFVTEGTISITNMQGIEVNTMKYNGEKTLKINVSSWPSGLYIIRMHSENGDQVAKLIRQ